MGFALSDMQLNSPAFDEGGPIPTRHTGEGKDVSPALTWTDAPEGTRSFAVFCHDPDAPLVKPDGSYGFVHWVCYNIPATTLSLPEAAGGFAQGRNDFGNNGYGGPMPPEGHGAHRYYFWVLALGIAPELDEGLGLRDLLQAAESHILGMNRLTGTYHR